MANSSRSGLVRVGHGCFVPESDANNLVARIAALLDVMGPDTVVSSISAARLHGLWLPVTPDVIHVATATRARPGRRMSRTRRPQVRAHRLQIDGRDVMMKDGLATLTPEGTWRDLATVLGLPDLVAAGDSVLRGGASHRDLADVVERAGAGRGTRKLRAALKLLDRRSRSRPETHLRVALVLADLPSFEVNEPVYRDESGWLAEPDLSLAEAKIALEYQGEDHATAKRMRSDITRDRDLRSQGWLTLYYGPAEVFGRPWTIAPEVRAAVRVRAPHLLTPPRRGTRPIARVVR